MLARKLSVADYGLYVMLIGLILALNSVQSALIVFPFTVRYAGSDLQLWQSGVVHCLLVSLITLPVQLSVVIAGSFYLHHLRSQALRFSRSVSGRHRKSFVRQCFNGSCSLAL